MQRVLFSAVLGLLILGAVRAGNGQPAPDPFDRWDRNGDGTLTRDELPEQARPNFDRADANADGVISREEHAAFRTGRPAEARAQAARPKPLQQRKEAARNASPITYVSGDDPPFLIVHGTDDMVVPFNQSERLEAALRDAGVDVTFIRIEGGGHGGFRSPELLRRVGLFFDKHLRGQSVEISAEPTRPEQRQDAR